MKKGNEPFRTFAGLIRAYHSLLSNLLILHLLPDVYFTFLDVKYMMRADLNLRSGVIWGQGVDLPKLNCQGKGSCYLPKVRINVCVELKNLRKLDSHVYSCFCETKLGSYCLCEFFHPGWIFLSIFSRIKKTHYFLSYIESNFLKERKGVGRAVWEEERTSRRGKVQQRDWQKMSWMHYIQVCKHHKGTQCPCYLVWLEYTHKKWV